MHSVKINCSQFAVFNSLAVETKEIHINFLCCSKCSWEVFIFGLPENFHSCLQHLYSFSKDEQKSLG